MKLIVSALFLLLIHGTAWGADLFQEAQKLHDNGFYEDAVVAWKKAAASDLNENKKTVARVQLSIAYFKLSEFDQALKTAEDLTQSKPENYHAQFNFGNLTSAMRKYSQSASAYESAVKLKPEEGLAYIGLALSLFGQGEKEKAREELWKVKKIFKAQKNISWHRNAQLMIAQIKHFDRYPPNFSDLWLTNNLQIVRENYEKDLINQ